MVDQSTTTLLLIGRSLAAKVGDILVPALRAYPDYDDRMIVWVGLLSGILGGAAGSIGHDGTKVAVAKVFDIIDAELARRGGHA